MILRRLARHLKEQNWTAVAVEFVIVVVGVFIGIQVSNWNEERQQATRQAAYMQRLRVDFIGIRDRIQEHFVVYRETDEGGELVLSLVRADEADLVGMDVGHERMARAFNALMSKRIPPPLPATYVEMLSEGQLSNIRNPALRDRLAEYDRLQGVVHEVARMTADNFVLQAPILQRHFVSRTVSDDSALSGIREELISYDLAAMRGDRDFAVATKMLQRYALNSRAQRKRQLTLIDQILTLIDAEIAR